VNGLVRWWQRLRERLGQRWVQMRAPGMFLCDTCRYDYGQACRRPERPNAAQCPGYKPR
jgi:hypothetical protein